MEEKYICRVCGKEIIYSGRQLYRRMRSHFGPDICFDCARKDSNKRISNSVKSLWANNEYRNNMVAQHIKDSKKRMEYNPNYFKELSNKFWNESSEEKIKLREERLSLSLKKYYSTLSPEERYRRIKPLLEGLQIYWDNISPEEKAVRVAKMFEGLDKWKSELSEEESSNVINIFNQWKEKLSDEELLYYKAKQKDGVRNYLLSLTEEERKRRNDNISKKTKERWENYSPEEQHRRNKILRDAFKEYWDNLTPEEYSKWNLKRSIGQGIAYSKPKETESEFMNILNIHKIEYKFQFYNQIEHPDFKTIFPINPVTGSNKIYPFHKWDFMITTNDGNILVDIDGSIHALKPKTSIVKGFDIGAYTRFNDMQRPYQTDGLDAYIILAYKNRLNEDNEVYCITDQTFMTVRELIEIIKFKNKFH